MANRIHRGLLGVLLACLICNACRASPRWKAPGLAKSICEADKVVEREHKRQERIAKVFGENPPTDKDKGYSELLVSVHECSLFTQTQQARISPLTMTTNADGSATILATWSRDKKGKNFYTKEESEKIADWERRIRESEKSYERRKRSYRNTKIIDDPAKDRDSEVQKLTENREKALAQVFETAEKRAERYTIVKLELRVPPSLALTLDRETLLNARIVPALIQPTECDIDIVDPALDWPPLVSGIQAELVEIDPSVVAKESRR